MGSEKLKLAVREGRVDWTRRACADARPPHAAAVADRFGVCEANRTAMTPAQIIDEDRSLQPEDMNAIRHSLRLILNR